jgi:hypothetical protein
LNALGQTHRSQFDYGKWLIASLLAVHVGSVFLMTQAGKCAIPIFFHAAHWNFFGIVMAILSGFFAFVNYQCLATIYQDWTSDPSFLYRLDTWPKEEYFGKKDPIGTSFILSIICGAGSLFGFLASCVNVYAYLGEGLSRC